MRDGWELVRLGDISTRVIGRTPPRNQARYWTQDLDRPFCTIADMKGERRISGGSEGVTQLAEEEGKAKRVPAGSLIVSFKLSLGRVGITDRDVFPNEAIAWVRPHKSILQEFLGIALEGVDWESLGGRAVKGKTLNSQSLDAIPIPLPPLREQERIVDLIAAVDETIEKAEAAHRGVSKTLSARRTAIFGALALEAPSTLEMVASRTIGRTPPRKSARYWTAEPGDRPFCTIAAMADQHVSGCSEGVTEEAEKDGVAKRVPAGSLLLSFKLSIGRLAIPDKDVFPNEAIAWIQPRDGVRQGYLQHALASVPWDEMGSRAVKGRTLNSESLNAVPVPLPTPEVQRAVEDELSILSSAHWGAERHLECLRSVRSNLLNALLSGGHLIPESYDEMMGDASNVVE